MLAPAKILNSSKKELNNRESKGPNSDSKQPERMTFGTNELEELPNLRQSIDVKEKTL